MSPAASVQMMPLRTGELCCRWRKALRAISRDAGSSARWLLRTIDCLERARSMLGQDLSEAARRMLRVLDRRMIAALQIEQKRDDDGRHQKRADRGCCAVRAVDQSLKPRPHYRLGKFDAAPKTLSCGRRPWTVRSRS